jgi:hypothetical protein
VWQLTSHHPVRGPEAEETVSVTAPSTGPTVVARNLGLEIGAKVKSS